VSLVEVTLLVARELERLEIPHLVGGSFASVIHGEPRLIRDVDFEVLMKAEHVDRLAVALERSFCVDREILRSAVRRGERFGVLHLECGFEVDVHVMEPSPFERSELNRARPHRLRREPEAFARVASSEDVVLRKLRGYCSREGLLDQQWRDVLGVIKTVRERMDVAYLRYWARRIEVSEALERALVQSGARPRSASA
jgi:hypothetical protein